MRISNWSSDVCSSDLGAAAGGETGPDPVAVSTELPLRPGAYGKLSRDAAARHRGRGSPRPPSRSSSESACLAAARFRPTASPKSEEHTSELTSLMSTSYTVFRLQRHNTQQTSHT